MSMPWTETEEVYQRVSQDFPVVPFPHYLSRVWEGMKRLYPNMTVEFWAAQERRVGIHWNMGLTVDRSIDELRPFAVAQLNSRRYDAMKEFRASRQLCKNLTGIAMKWDFDGQGGWDARSAFAPEGIPRDWRIVVCDDGTFDVNESDESLLPARKINCFPNLREAKEWCVNREEDYRSHEPCEGYDVPDSGKDHAEAAV